MTTTGAATVVATHPEATDDPRTLRWVVHGVLAGSAAGPLEALVRSGSLAGFRLGSDAVLTTLAEGRDWRTEGPVVRRAVQATLAGHTRVVRDATGADQDAILARVAEQVLAEVVAPVARAHGGDIELVAATDGVVTVRLRGACHGCPISAMTLHGRLERELRLRLPWLRGVATAP